MSDADTSKLAMAIPVKELYTESVLDARMQLHAPDTCDGLAPRAMPQLLAASLRARRLASRVGQATAVVLALISL